MKIICTALVLSITACSSSKNTSTTSPPDTAKIEYTNTTAEADDCYYPRKTIVTMTDSEGLIALVAETYIITNTDGTARYQPCKLPASFCKEGMSVQFSGDKLEINPGERRFAAPFRLRHIKQR